MADAQKNSDTEKKNRRQQNEVATIRSAAVDRMHMQQPKKQKKLPIHLPIS